MCYWLLIYTAILGIKETRTYYKTLCTVIELTETESTGWERTRNCTTIPTLASTGSRQDTKKQRNQYISVNCDEAKGHRLVRKELWRQWAGYTVVKRAKTIYILYNACCIHNGAYIIKAEIYGRRAAHKHRKEKEGNKYAGGKLLWDADVEEWTVGAIMRRRNRHEDTRLESANFFNNNEYGNEELVWDWRQLQLQRQKRTKTAAVPIQRSKAEYWLLAYSVGVASWPVSRQMSCLSWMPSGCDFSTMTRSFPITR